MKRHAPLQRHTPLTGSIEKDREWRHRSTLAAIQRRQEKPQRRPMHTPAKVRDLVVLRSVIAVGLDPDDYPAGLCELCGAPGTNTHTRRPDGMGGTKRPDTYRASNKVRVCGHGNVTGCHGALEGHRAWALGRGLLLKQSQNPTEVPIQLHYGLVLLGDDGSTAPYQGAAA